MKKFASIALVLLVAGCADIKPVTIPDKTNTYAIDCTGLLDWNYCYGRADKLCGAGNYDVIDKKGTYTSNLELTVACKGPPISATGSSTWF